MELSEGTLKHLQEYIASKIKERGFEDESVHERLLLLSEEVGELIKACRKLTGMNVKDGEQQTIAGEEVADVINMIFAVAVKLGIDVEKEFLEKEEKIGKRVYRRANDKA